MVYVYDLEQLANLHTATFMSLDKQEVKVFVIHDLRDDRKAYMEFLLQPELRLIGYNCMNYDYQILHRLIMSRDTPRFKKSSSKQLSEWLYSISQDIISGDASPVPEWKYIIPQRDLFKVHHFDNRARSTSLKALEMVMQVENVQDMPYPHYSYITTLEEINEILEYNFNDVDSTHKFYLKSEEEITMRRDVGKLFNIYIMNANDPKIGQEIILKKVAHSMGVSVRSLRDLRTYRRSIALKYVILSIVKFVTPEFQKALNSFKEIKANPENLKGAFNIALIFDGMEYRFGLGGLHACREANSWFSTENMQIKSADVTSYYPNLAIKNKFYPKHLGEDFCTVYEDLFETRKHYPKGTPGNKGLKLGLNGAFGKSNDKYSPLYDPRLTVQITINGQLLLAMLCEWVTAIGCKVIMVNTDGIEAEVSKDKEEAFYEICSKWEKLTQLELEQTSYSAMYIRDVNNYIGVLSSGDVYLKGAYEVEKAWHKNHSMKVVPLAVRNFFVAGTPIMDTLKAHDNIFDFMMHVRVRSSSTFKLKTIVEDMHLSEQVLPKTNRYIIVHGGIGGYLFKEFDTGRVSKVNVGYKASICNNMSPLSLEVDRDNFHDHIDYRFYYNEAMKLIAPIIRNQLNIF
jgi:hypothetical protein